MKNHVTTIKSKSVRSNASVSKKTDQFIEENLDKIEKYESLEKENKLGVKVNILDLFIYFDIKIIESD